MKKLSLLMILLIIATPLTVFSGEKTKIVGPPAPTKKQIVVSDTSGSPRLAVSGTDVVLEPSTFDGSAFVLNDAESITLFDRGDGIRDLRGQCGLNDCFAWITGTETLIIEQPSGWSAPSTFYSRSGVEISADSATSESRNMATYFEAVSIRTCRTCGNYPQHCGDFETWTCNPDSGCTWCTRCTSRPC